MSLYVVATPIGNLKDISYRAVEILNKVQFILAEDTRHTGKLLKAYDIRTKLVSYREQNHDRMIDKIKQKLDSGFSLALVSDAGTPGISDPGYRLVNELKRNGYEVVGIPGASACITALTVSGLPPDKFLFLGFLPKSVGKRRKILKQYLFLDCTVILYEAPTRLIQLLTEISSIDPERLVSVAAELTKLHEKVETKMLAEFLVEYDDSKFTPKGEYVVMVAKQGMRC